jgi:hypothetical protein
MRAMKYSHGDTVKSVSMRPCVQTLVSVRPMRPMRQCVNASMRSCVPMRQCVNAFVRPNASMRPCVHAFMRPRLRARPHNNMSRALYPDGVRPCVNASMRSCVQCVNASMRPNISQRASMRAFVLYLNIHAC